MGEHSTDQAAIDNVPVSAIKVQWESTETVNTKYQIRIIQWSSSMDFIPSYSDMLNTKYCHLKGTQISVHSKSTTLSNAFGYKRRHIYVYQKYIDTIHHLVNLKTHKRAKVNNSHSSMLPTKGPSCYQTRFWRVRYPWKLSVSLCWQPTYHHNRVARHSVLIPSHLHWVWHINNNKNLYTLVHGIKLHLLALFARAN